MSLIYKFSLRREANLYARMVCVTTGFSALFKKYIYDENKSSAALTTTLNNYIHIVVREVYCSGGDVLKFSGENIVYRERVCTSERTI